MKTFTSLITLVSLLGTGFVGASTTSPVCANGLAPGLLGSYYSGQNFDTFLHSRVSTNLGYTVSSTTGYSAIPIPNYPTSGAYSVRWTGFFKPATTRSYLFQASVNGFATVDLDGVNILATDTEKTIATTIPAKVATATYTAGVYYPITINFYDNYVSTGNTGTSGSRVTLQYTPLGGSLTTIPASELFYCFDVVVTSASSISFTPSSPNSAVSFSAYLSYPPSATTPVTLTLSLSGGANDLPIDYIGSTCSYTFTSTSYNVDQAISGYIRAISEVLSSNTYSLVLSVTASGNYQSGSITIPVTFTNTPVALKSCSTYGDPHVITFDGARYDSYVAGTYYVLRDSCYSFVFQALQTSCGVHGGACNAQGIIRYGSNGLVRIFTKNRVPSFYIENMSGVSGFKLTKIGSTVYNIYFPNGVKISTRILALDSIQTDFLSFTVYVPPSIATSHLGLCKASGSPVPCSEDLFVNPYTTSIPVTCTVVPKTDTAGNVCQVSNSVGLTASGSTVTFETSGPSTAITCSSNPTVTPTLPPGPPPPICTSLFVDSSTAATCLSQGVDTNKYYQECVNDVGVTESTLLATTIYETMILECNIPDCKTACSLAGTCNAGSCSCYAGHTGTDCEQDNTLCPVSTVFSPALDSLTIGTVVTVTGQYFYSGSALYCIFGESAPVVATRVSDYILTCVSPIDTTTAYSLSFGLTRDSKTCSTSYTLRTPTGNGHADPHFRGFDGSMFDFQGNTNKDSHDVYNLITDFYFNLNSEFIVIPESHIDGTYMSKIGAKCFDSNIEFNRNGEIFIDGGLTLLTDIVKFKHGRVVPNAPLFQTLPDTTEGTLKSTIRVDCSGYSVLMMVVGHHLDFQVAINLGKVGTSVHGVLGQTIERIGQTPRVAFGPNGEGVIDGGVEDYIVKDGLFGNKFNFNKYNVSPPSRASGELRSVLEGENAYFIASFSSLN